MCFVMPAAASFRLRQDIPCRTAFESCTGVSRSTYRASDVVSGGREPTPRSSCAPSWCFLSNAWRTRSMT